LPQEFYGLEADRESCEGRVDVIRRLVERRAIEVHDVVVVGMVDVGTIAVIVLFHVMGREMAVSDGVLVFRIRLVDVRRREGRGQRQVRPNQADRRRASQDTTNHRDII
jgi:hypothetical protein